MARSRIKSRGRRESGSYVALPHELLNHPNFFRLSAHAKVLLLDLFAQFKGANNGDLTATWTIMQKRGWKSRDTLGKALRELLDRGWIERTRVGGLHWASLYAVTWLPIDDCKGKLDVPATRVASGAWKTETLTRPPCHTDTPAVSITGARGAKPE